MDDPTETPAPQDKVPLFAEDVPCPQCGYNLRGLVRPICPECGHVFDANALLNEMRLASRRVPWLRIARMMYVHPVRAWAKPVMRSCNAPGLGLAAVCATVGALIPTMVLFLLLLSAPGPMGPATIMLAPLVAGAVGICLAVSGMHTLLCRLALPAPGGLQAWQGVRRVLNCCSAWSGPGVAGLTGCVYLLIIAVVGRAFGQPSQVEMVTIVAISGVAIALSAVSCILWGISLYAGMRAHYPANRNYAIWCVLCNPLWYVAGFLIASLVHQLSR